MILLTMPFTFLMTTHLSTFAANSMFYNLLEYKKGCIKLAIIRSISKKKGADKCLFSLLYSLYSKKLKAWFDLGMVMWSPTKRRRSVPSLLNKTSGNEHHLWHFAVDSAADNLSRSDRRKFQKSSLLDKAICRSRTLSDLEALEERKQQYLGLVESNLLMKGADHEVKQQRKLAVCERNENDRRMVFQTIKTYRQMCALKAWEYI